MNNTIAFRRFGVCDDISSFHALIGFRDRNCLFLKIKIRRCQRKQFTLSNSSPIEHFKGIEGTRLVHHRFDELQILAFVQNCISPFFCLPHIARLCCRIRFRTIVPDRMVEHRAELIMKRFQVYRRICFSCF